MVIRPFVLHDGELRTAFALFSDDRVMAHMVSGPCRSMDEVRKRLAPQADRSWWAVELKETAELIGATQLSVFDGHENVLQLSFLISPAFWGRGLAFEAAAATVERAASEGAEKIVAGTLGHNPKSSRTLIRLGFEHKGEIVWPDNGKSDPYYELRLE